jgi:hypothetical protein
MKKFLAFVAPVVALSSSALATVEADVTAAVTAAQTAGENVLGVAAGILGAFLIFKLVKRAANKA